ncbi:hypothetical protein PoB_006939000 [Plakobranchus ocellatus]|uniref:Uncharacterized protein n=1 Tax=Plakobranchus ocellatus TaxID=259542 RepID=A0AAV4DFU5_9GAST|nr:hypothetical protein PoB_006939000 [Plakobranchus ocellatus]
MTTWSHLLHIAIPADRGIWIGITNPLNDVKVLRDLATHFSARRTQRSNEKLTWPELGFEPRASDLVANCPTR